MAIEKSGAQSTVDRSERREEGGNNKPELRHRIKGREAQPNVCRNKRNSTIALVTTMYRIMKELVVSGRKLFGGPVTNVNCTLLISNGEHPKM